MSNLKPVVQEAAPLRRKLSASLRDAMSSGALPPGTRLVEKDLCQDLGVSRTALREIPASWHVSTTAVTSLYDSGASSITSFGDATRMAMPFVFRPSSTSW